MTALTAYGLIRFGSHGNAHDPAKPAVMKILKKIIKIIKIILIIFISLAVLLYGGVYIGHTVIFPIKTSNVPTIDAVTDGFFTFGVQANMPHPKTLDEYIPVLAAQVKRYNEIAPDIWPGNALVNQTVIAEGIKSNKIWLIEPDGAASLLSKKKADSYGFQRRAYVNGFTFFDGGTYLAIAENDLQNYLIWQKYLHLGEYDQIFGMIHEVFHALEQPKWRTMSTIPNAARNGFLENTPARAKRNLMQKQLLKAVSEPGNTPLILEALATYADWKAQFPDDYNGSVYFERVEGTAQYIELVSGLYCGYPAQIKNSDDVERALTLLATREDIYIGHGLISECYTVSGFSCVLLDRLESDWKERLMDDTEATPIEMLYQHFKDTDLPVPIQLTQADMDKVAEEIHRPSENRGMPLLFQFLFDYLF